MHWTKVGKLWQFHGSIEFANSEGTNELIKEGATLVMNYKDVIKKII